MREKLLRANPESGEAARDVAVAHFKLGQFGQKTGNEALMLKHNQACYELLHQYISGGATFDQPIMDLYQDLHQAFGKGE